MPIPPPEPIILAEKDGYYLKNELYYPRTTHILDIISKPEIAIWRGRVGNLQADEIAKSARDIGTDFHAMAADINHGKHLDRRWHPEDRFRRMATQYIDWIHENVESVQIVENTLYNDEPDRLFGGTPDLVATLRGDAHPSLIDIKTSSKPSVDWPLQLSAYRYILQRVNGLHIIKRIIIRVSKKDEPLEMFSYMDHDEDEEAWWHAFHLWKWGTERKERLKRSKPPRVRKSK